MNINLYKYQQPDGTVANYFSQSYAGIGFIDTITLTNIMTGGFPIFNEEYTKEDDVNVIKSGDYDLQFSLLQNETSHLGKNIKEFLLPDSDRNFLLLCSFEFDGIERWGTVDITSIKANYTVTQNRYDISFTVYGLLKELVQGLKQYVFMEIEDPYGHAYLTFDEFINNVPSNPSYYRINPNIGQLTIDNRLGMDHRVEGEPVKVDNHMLSSLFQGGLNRGYTSWDGLKSFAVGLGFVMRLEKSSIIILNKPYRVYPCFKLVLFWRGEDENYKTVDVMEDEESNSLLLNNPFFLIVYNQFLSGGVGADTLHGLLMTGVNNQYMSDEWGVGSFANDILLIRDRDPYEVEMNGIITYQIPQNLVNKINLNLHAGITYLQHQIYLPFCRALTMTDHFDDIDPNNNFGLIIWYTAKQAYKYLLSGFKEKRDLKVSLLNNNYKIFDQITYGNKNYWISRISDLNLYQKTARIEAIRI